MFGHRIVTALAATRGLPWLVNARAGTRITCTRTFNEASSASRCCKGEDARVQVEHAAGRKPSTEISGQICTAGWGLTFVAVVDAILLDDRLFAV